MHPSRCNAAKSASITWRRSFGTRSGTLGPKPTAAALISVSHSSRMASSKNDIEYILMLRKPGGYRSPSTAARLLSIISADEHDQWFRQIWNDVSGASTRDHPAPFPLDLAERLIRMFSFVGDTVFDPFTGTATTQVAARTCGRNSIGVEVEPTYHAMAKARLTP